MRWPVLIRLTVLLTLALAVVMFTIQNLSRTSSLSFDAYFWAWQLSRPVPVPFIIWGSFSAGVLLTGIVTWGRARRLARKVAQLEQDALLRSAGRAPTAAVESPKAPPGDDWGR